MSRFEETLQRDLRQIADRATPSPDAWNSILTRIADQEPPHETEIIMLTDNTIRTKRWPLYAAAAAVAALLIGGIALVARDDSPEAPADQPPPTVETPVVQPEPGAAEVDDTPAIEDGTTRVEDDVAGPSAAVTVSGRQEGVRTSGDALADGSIPITGSWTLEGEMTGDVTLTGSNFAVPPNGDIGGTTDYVFTGTIDGLGTGTLTFSDEWVSDLVNGGVDMTITVTGGTGDFAGLLGWGELSDQQITYEGRNELISGTITFTIAILGAG
jgi:hypothetical protein